MVNKLDITSFFKEKRSKYIYVGGRFIDGFHEGVDLSSGLYKKQEIFSEIGGKVVGVDYLKNSYGRRVLVETDLSRYSKVFDNVRVYSLYGHLNQVCVLMGDIFDDVVKIGYMGNTGYCLTKIKEGSYSEMGKEFRRVSEAESFDYNFIGGVHLHFSLYFLGRDEAYNFVKVYGGKVGDDILFQWGKYYVNPFLLDNFFRKEGGIR